MTLHTGLKFKTSAPIAKLEDWLENNCNGEWDLDIEAISTQLQQKSVAVYFETEEDRDAFKSAYKDIK
ncbi:MAG: hypothetical protein OQK24_06755 [Magnetovibrio sp.]|nr:hypothetical protein [Magnetovibrio sp.]